MDRIGLVRNNDTGITGKLKKKHRKYATVLLYAEAISDIPLHTITAFHHIRPLFPALFTLAVPRKIQYTITDSMHSALYGKEKYAKFSVKR